MIKGTLALHLQFKQRPQHIVKAHSNTFMYKYNQQGQIFNKLATEYSH